MKKLDLTNLATWLATLIIVSSANPTRSHAPDVNSLKAALVSSDGQYLYLLKGNDVIQVSVKYKAEGCLVDAAVLWPGLEHNVDAMAAIDGPVYFFKGTEYRVVTNNSVSDPRWIQSCWPAIFRAGGVDAAGNRNGKPYFFKGCHFWSPLETAGSNGYLQQNLATVNLPCDLDAAWESGTDLIISKANRYWIWGNSSNATGPFPLGEFLSICTWDWGSAPGVSLASPLVCNGDSRLCSLTVDKVTLAGSHNAGSGFAGPFAPQACYYQNQNTSVLEQLRFGIRYLDVDSCWTECGDNLGTCHKEYCAGMMCSMLVQIRTFLVENPTEIVVVNFNHDMTGHHQVIPELVRQIDEVLSPFLNSHFRETEEWPTLEQAVLSGKRLFVIIAKEVTDSVIYYQKLWMVSERYLASTYKLTLVFSDCSSVVSSTRDKCRDLAERSLLEVSVFGGFGSCVDVMMAKCDDFLFSTLEACSDFRTNAQKAPNVLMVDYPAISPPLRNVVAAVRQQNARNLLAFRTKCRVRLDAATNMNSGSSSAFFTGNRVLHFSKADWAQEKIETLESFSPNLPSNIDSAISGRYWGRLSQAFFFKGCNYWILENGVAVGPFAINKTFPGLMCDIQAAAGINRVPHFFKGCSYWAYKAGRGLEGPNPIVRSFPGLPCNIDAALNLNDAVYFFQNSNSRKGTYWSYKNSQLSQGRSVLDWNIDPVICEG